MSLVWTLLGYSLVAFVVFVVVAIVVERFFIAAPAYKPSAKKMTSDHFDGEKFFNPNAPPETTFSDVIRWQMNAEPGQWTLTPWDARTDAPYGARPPERIASGAAPRITFVNHATVLIQFGGLNILTDPVWSERASPFSFVGPIRQRPPGLRFEDLPPIDVVLLSHNHYDHCDTETLVRLWKRFHPRIYVPLGMKDFIEGIDNGDLAKNLTKSDRMRVVGEMDWGESLPLLNVQTSAQSSPHDTLTPSQSALELHCVRAQHFSGRGISDRNRTLWCGFVLREIVPTQSTDHSSSAARTIYFAGDTGYNDHFKRIREQFGVPTVALLPIGAYRPEWFMSPVHVSPKEAVQAFLDLGKPFSIGIHFGTFSLADDGELDPIHDLQAALEAASNGNANSLAKRFVTLKEGDGITIERH
jgi:L-ascorbate metabolism protein UlaG (beta-lactamase superfamily)